MTREESDYIDYESVDECVEALGGLSIVMALRSGAAPASFGFKMVAGLGFFVFLGFEALGVSTAGGGAAFVFALPWALVSLGP